MLVQSFFFGQSKLCLLDTWSRARMLKEYLQHHVPSREGRHCFSQSASVLPCQLGEDLRGRRGCSTLDQELLTSWTKNCWPAPSPPDQDLLTYPPATSIEGDSIPSPNRMTPDEQGDPPFAHGDLHHRFLYTRGILATHWQCIPLARSVV